MDRTVVALFDDVQTAQRALEELLSNGFDRNDISVVRTNETTAGAGSTTSDSTMPSASGVATGAGIGAALGGIAGLVIGLGVLAIPGIGPVVAAGPLATTLAGAGIGAATGGIIGALTDVGIPEDEAGYYAEGIRRGGTLLTVRAGENQVTRATQLLNKYSPVDISQRAGEWRSSGWSGYDPNARSFEGSGSSTGSAGQYASTGAGMGGMSSSRFEDFDDQFRSDFQTRYGRSGFDYNRYQPAYRYGWESRSRYQGRNWNDVESEMRTDWQRTHPSDKWEDFKDSIRTGWDRFKQGVGDTTSDVKQGARDMSHDAGRTYDRTTSDMSRSFDRYDPDFRNDYEQSFRTSGYGYERYQPAYQYGYTLATEKQYSGRDWNAIEADARRDWEMRHPGDRWEDFKDAVQHAWRRVKADVRDAMD